MILKRQFMRGYIYARVSTQTQNYERQLSELKQYAEQHHIEIVETFQEKISGRKTIRPEFERMKKSITGNLKRSVEERIDIILVWEISRLSRRMIDLQKNVIFFIEEGVRIFCKKDNWTTHTDDGKLDNAHLGMLSILASFAESEVQNTRERIKSSINYRLKRGDSYATKPPFGYIIKDHKLVINDEKKNGESLSEADIVRRIFSDSANGKSTHKIGIELRAETGNRNKWSNNSVLRMLKNPCYCGYAYFGRTRQHNERKEIEEKGGIANEEDLTPLVRVETPAIVSKELWEKSRDAIFERRSRSKSGNQYPSALLRSLLFCPICGHRYTYSKKLYQCISLTTDKYNYCGAKGISVKNLDYAVWTMLQDLFKKEMSQQEIEKLKAPILNEIEQLEIKISNFKAQVKGISNEIKDHVGEATKFRKKNLKIAYEVEMDEISKLESEATQFEEMEKSLENEKSIKERKLRAIENSNVFITDETDKREFVLKVIESITLYTIQLDKKYLSIEFKNGTICDMWYRYNRGNRTSYFAYLPSEGTVSFCWKQDEIVRGLPKDLYDQIGDFSVDTANNPYFNEEVFGDYTYDDFWNILQQYGYVHEIPLK